MPVKVKIPVTASELNDLRVMLGNAEAVNAWRSRKIEKIRETVRNTTEAMCSVVMSTGKLTWPVELEGGCTEIYEVDYGAPLSYTPTAKLSATSKLPDVYRLLRDMELEVKKAGLGGNVEFWAGSDVVAVLLAIVENFTSTVQNSQPYTVKLEQGKIMVGNYSIRFMDETYPDPSDETTWLPKLDSKTMLATATNVQGSVWYCAIDSISANNAALPLHIVPVMRPDDSGLTLIGQAKPLPARPSKGTCKAVVVV
ncbi:MAG: major capsid protein [Pseudomonadota bacterium]